VARGGRLAAGLLLTGLRKHLRTPWPYAAAGIALLMFSPFVVWNAAHGFPHLEFIRNATAGKYSGLARGDFLAGQVFLPGPLSLLLWLPGLIFLLTGRDGRRHRILGIIYLTGLAVLLANPHSKAEYLGPAYTMLFAAGGVSLERFSKRPGRGWAAPAVALAGALTSLALLPFAVPVLPVRAFIRYAAAVGMKPSTAESKTLAELPQIYADMFGWEEMAADVSAVYLSLPGPERVSAAVLARNYGEAASLEYWSRKYPLPRVISTHNNYWLWGYPKEGLATIIVLGGRSEDHLKAWEEVRHAATHAARYAMPYETNLPVFICRGLRVSLEAIWEREKNFN
jgi:hypothetical protein